MIGCFAAIVLAILPRLGVLILWIFTERMQQAFSLLVGPYWLWTLLGLIFLPWTTLGVVVAASFYASVGAAGWALVLLGLALDMVAYAAGHRYRRSFWLFEDPAAA